MQKFIQVTHIDPSSDLESCTSIRVHIEDNIYDVIPSNFVFLDDIVEAIQEQARTPLLTAQEAGFLFEQIVEAVETMPIVL